MTDGAAAKPCATPSQSTRYTKGVGLPASAELVTATGGTQLSTDRSAGAYGSETVWNNNMAQGSRAASDHLDASGGGYSSVYPVPSYQRGTAAGRDGHRGVPDVSASASQVGGMMIVLAGNGKQLIVPATGTSASAPTWAAIAALADQYAHRSLGFLNPAIYRVATGPDYHRAFHDVRTGDNTVKAPSGQAIDGYSAAPGWDAATGWGSPNAAVLVPLLARADH